MADAEAERVPGSDAYTAAAPAAGGPAAADAPVHYASAYGRRQDGGLLTTLTVASSIFLVLGAAMLLVADLHNGTRWFLLVPWAVQGVVCCAMLLAARTPPAGPRSARQRFPAAPLAIFLCGLALGGVGLAGSVIGRDPHARAGVYRCQSNLRDVWAAIGMYTAANGGKMPRRLEELVSSPTIDLAAQSLVCPAADPADPAGAADAVTSYVYVGAGLAAPLAPTAVVAYELPGNHGGMNVLFGNGSVKELSAREGRRLVEALNAGHNPPQD